VTDPVRPDEASRSWQTSTNLIWTHYDDSDRWVVYNPASSNIHLLTSAARELWALVEREPAASDDLTVRLAAVLGRPLDAELVTVTRDTLAFMDRAGLIRPVLP
jgi:PqqD family protein of HPr-rel-A system